MIKKYKDIEKHSKFISNKVYQVDNLDELREETTIKELLTYDYIMECDTVSLYKIVK